MSAYWCVDCVAYHHCKLHEDLATAKRLLKACVTRGDVTQKMDARDEAIRFLSRDRWAKEEALGPQDVSGMYGEGK